MNREFLSLFPTPILNIYDFITEQERLNIFEKVINTFHYEHECLSGNAFSTHYTKDNNILDASIVSRIEDEIDNFAEIYGISKLKVTNYWSNIQGPGGQLLPHRHANSRLSGSLYINVDENSHKLYFFNPNQFNRFELFETYNELNWNHYSILPKNCQLIIFPSWLEHSSNGEKNNTDSRVVISFNTFDNNIFK